MKALATEAVGVLGSLCRRNEPTRNLGMRFVNNLPHDHILLELADECFNAMTKEQRRQFPCWVCLQTSGPRRCNCDSGNLPQIRLEETLYL